MGAGGRVAARILSAVALAVGVALAGAVARDARAASDRSVMSPDFTPVFEHMTVDEGLPDNSVRAIVQDASGFLWFGTQNGLARYDGYEARVYLPIAGDTTSIGDRTIEALCVDRRGRLWVGTFLRGLWRFDARTETFRDCRALEGRAGTVGGHVHDVCEDASGAIWAAMSEGLVSVDAESGAVTHRRVAFVPEGEDAYAFTAVLTDREGNVWVGTEGRGVAVLDRDGSTRFPGTGGAGRGALVSPYVHDIFQTADGTIVIATEEGLSVWNPADSTFAAYQPEPGAGAVSTNRLLRVTQGGGDVLFIGSVAGIYAFDVKERHFRLFAPNPERAFSLSPGPILSILCDRSGIVWAGAWYSALNKFDPTGNRFQVARHDASDPGSLPWSAVLAVHVDADGTVWLGTSDHARGGEHGALVRRRANHRAFERVPAQGARGGQLVVRSILRDSASTLWLGTSEGLWVLANERARSVRAGAEPARAALAGARVRALAEDRHGRLWIGTQGDGLFRLDAKTSDLAWFRHDKSDAASVSEDAVIALHVDGAGRVWAGTDARGLNLFLSDTRGFARFFDPDIALDSVVDIIDAPDGGLWLATFAGVLRFDPETGVTAAFGRPQGLPNDQVVSLLAARDGRLWLSTGNGLARLDAVAGTVRKFDARDGLPTNEPHFARARGTDERLYFGGPAGLVSFDPEEFRDHAYMPPVVLTGITVDDAPLKVKGDSPLAEPLHLPREVALRHDQNDISISFAALDYARPERNRYRFRLDDDDDRWREPARGRTATYTNLGPGSYVFRVQGSNRDGVWSPTSASIRIRILPPWWRTRLAHALYALGLLAAGWVVYRQIVHRERMHAALAVEKAEAAQLQELDRMKSRFLTNISHEFRTPLTLIKTPLARLVEQPASGERKLFETMSRNAERLSQLIDQLLDLSRLEAGRLPVKWQSGNYVEFLRALISSFDSLAELRGIRLNVIVSASESTGWYDPDLLEKVVSNLLSNALKFTPEGGEATVEIAVGADVEPTRVPRSTKTGAELPPADARRLILTVDNTGTYVPPSEQARIFDRFHQFGPGGGTGVGLALVRELTEWMGGTVSLSSDRETGTRFTVSLPIFVTAPSPESVATPADDRVAAANPRPAGAIDEVEMGTPEPAQEEDAAPLVLVVEDHLDLLGYLQKELSPAFRVTGAVDGLAGLDAAVSTIPDLVLSDVMMPKMNGFELCRRLKKDERTSHIPVILLTARTETESRRHGLETGADDYLAKPFSLEELRIRIRNLIEQRRKLAEQFARQVAMLSPEAMPVTSADERFVLRAREVVEGHLDDPDFRIETLCREVGMSRAQLHRKLKAVTGRSAWEFVRIHRLQRAAQLLEAGYGNVTEVALAVGFRHLSHFAKSFREQYGSPPSDYPPRA